MAESFLTFKVERNVENSNKQTKIKLDLDGLDLDSIMIAFLQFAFLDLHIDIGMLEEYFKERIIKESGIDDDCDCPDCVAERESMLVEDKPKDVMAVAIQQKNNLEKFKKELNKSPDFLKKVFDIYTEWMSDTN